GSEEVKSRVERAGLVAQGPIEVLPFGVDHEWFSDDGGPREDFFLVAGRIKWWKNIELAIEGFAQAHRRGSSASLVIAGLVDALGEDYLESLRAQARDLPVRFEVDPPPERLRELYRR